MTEISWSGVLASREGSLPFPSIQRSKGIDSLGDKK